MKPVAEMSDADVINAARQWDELHGEGSYNPYEVEKEKRIERELADEWTREATIAKRRAWNDAVRAGKMATAADIDQWLRTHRWGPQQLKAAVAKHNL
jgi:hypothetical protein